jgi:hypothetical protein
MAMASQTPDTGERVELAESHEPATTGQDTAAPKSLKMRLADIRDECAGFTKDNINMGTFTIKGHTFEAILSEVRPLLHKHGVDIEPTLVDRAYSGNRCDVLVDFTFERTDDSDEKRTIRWGGAGTDNGDKAFAKAGTNCVKEMLKKRFLITDRDDAKEEEEKVEHQTQDGINRAQMEALEEQRKKAVAKWAGTLKAALDSAQTVDDVKRLERDNRDQLTSEDLQEVTRTYFVEHIEKRKKELA